MIANNGYDVTANANRMKGMYEAYLAAQKK